MENYVDPSLAQEMTDATAQQKVDALFSYMEERGQSFYDEVVTQLEHALQCAALAKHRQTHPTCLLYTSPSPRDRTRSRMPSSA